MRLRNIPGSKEMIATSEYVVQQPEQWKGKWNTFFGNDHPIFIEIGMGKGQFLLEMARQHPKNNYLGIEMYDSVLIRALEKECLKERHNVKYLRLNAEELTYVFEKDEIFGIYLNFSDPWPKERYAKRRLTSGIFLRRYENVLIQGGRLEFKTDNRTLFDFSIEEAECNHWHIDVCTYDLHKDAKLCHGNIMTEYEEKFVGLGNPIHKMVIYYK